MNETKRTAVVTGATGGLGSILAHDLAGLGFNLALLAMERNRLEALVNSLALPSERVLAQAVDLLDPVETQNAARAVIDAFGQMDVLLHVVGGWTGGNGLLEASADDLRFMLNQHVWTSFHVVRAFVPYLVNHGWGRIIMVTTPYAARPNAGGGPYAIGKAGQEALMLTLSQELSGTGVTANLLQVKTIDLQDSKVTHPSEANAYYTTPGELSAAVRFLISNDAGTINGARLPLYGSY
jgi:NAD(P)-dependent dehydrogenase (short-subunit alcohol dehydrogenase family)